MLSSLVLLLAGCGSEPSTIVEVSNIVEACCCDDGGCCDTGASTGPGEPTGAPVATVSVEFIDLGVICEGGGDATFTIGNEGDGVLELTLDSVEGDWEVLGVVDDVPAGGTVDVVVSGSGSGSITFATNDPNNPTITVGLSATVNDAPTITLGAIPDIIAPGAVETFGANVDDDQGPTNLALNWTSDQDGVLSTDGADAAGAASMVWDAAVRTSNTHTVTLTATDECGATATVSFEVCQNEGYSEASMDISDWQRNGVAIWDDANDWLQLTSAITNQAGSAYMTSETVTSDDVAISFQFYVGDSDSGADGLALTAIDTTSIDTAVPAAYVGTNGDGLGFGGLTGWHVAVDTFNNLAWTDSHADHVVHGDPASGSDHVSVVFNGAYNQTEKDVEVANLEDDAWHTLDIEVTGTFFEVSLDSVVIINEDFPGAPAAFPAHIGFSAGTGSRVNDHRIDSLTVTGMVCD